MLPKLFYSFFICFFVLFCFLVADIIGGGNWDSDPLIMDDIPAIEIP